MKFQDFYFRNLKHIFAANRAREKGRNFCKRDSFASLRMRDVTTYADWRNSEVNNTISNFWVWEEEGEKRNTFKKKKKKKKKKKQFTKVNNVFSSSWVRTSEKEKERKFFLVLARDMINIILFSSSPVL